MELQAPLFGHDLNVERTAARDGANAAAERASRAHRGWHTRALSFFVDFLATCEHSFMTEDIRQAATAAGLPEPPDCRAWGAVTQVLADKGVIRRIGYGPQKSAGCHAAPKSIWRKGNAKALRKYAEEVAEKMRAFS